jgi:hypothetical protein
MLPYDGMTRTGSKGFSHSVTWRPLARNERYWKASLKASQKGKPNKALSVPVALVILRARYNDNCRKGMGDE